MSYESMNNFSNKSDSSLNMIESKFKTSSETSESAISAPVISKEKDVLHYMKISHNKPSIAYNDPKEGLGKIHSFFFLLFFQILNRYFMI